MYNIHTTTDVKIRYRLNWILFFVSLPLPKTLPALFNLYLHGFLSREFVILGYSRYGIIYENTSTHFYLFAKYLLLLCNRSKLTSEEIRNRYRPFLEEVGLLSPPQKFDVDSIQIPSNNLNLFFPGSRLYRGSY